MNLFSIFIDSFRIAIHALKNNKTRSFLSLLGICIGIFSIISVKSAVDSFHDTISDGFSEFGSDVLYIDKRPWIINSRKEWLKYNKRPEITYRHYEHLNENLKNVSAISFAAFTGGEIIKYGTKNVSNAFILGSTMDYNKINDLKFEQGRYFTHFEFENATNKVILGKTVSDNLFEGLDPIGKKVKLYGQNFIVIGVLEKEGESMFNFMNFDEVIWTSYENFGKFHNMNNTNQIGVSLAVKAQKGTEIEDLKDDIIGFMRPKRYLRPLDKNNFSINEISVLNEMIDKLFGILNIAGLFIGIFSLIIGMFSVANIMFVSVKERTNIIGIKKALGAKQVVILIEFLIESIILCLIGGIVGIGMVMAVLAIITNFFPIELYMSFGNVINALIGSIFVGIIAGIIPAFSASRLNPVDAIRQ